MDGTAQRPHKHADGEDPAWPPPDGGEGEPFHSCPQSASLRGRLEATFPLVDMGLTCFLIRTLCRFIVNTKVY